jgi:hypothetical protein
VDALSEWRSRYSGSDLERLLEVIQEAGAQESVSLHTLRVGAAPSGEVGSNSIFGPADAAEFAQRYQDGHLGPIAELLQRNHDRLLAVTEKDLSAVAHTEYLPPSCWVYVPGPGRKNVFSELKKKALSGDSAQVREAFDAFNRALPHERSEQERRHLAEWKGTRARRCCGTWRCTGTRTGRRGAACAT